MDKQQLYDSIAGRKHTPDHLKPYEGGNGRVDRCIELFRKGVLKTGGTLLDVGGSIGDLGYALKDDFDLRIIVDISSKVLEAARLKGNVVYCCDVDARGLHPLRDETIDVVTALDFIEHIVDPGGFAKECFRVLNPGGQVFINTPNMQYFEHLESMLYQGVFPHTSGDTEVYHGGHLAFFFLDDLFKIFGKEGFVKCQQIKDEYGYKNPPQMFVQYLKPKSRDEFIDAHMRLGNPNLLFVAEKPSI